MNFLKRIKALFENKARLLQVIAAAAGSALLLGVFLYCYVRYHAQIVEIFGDPAHLEAFLAQFNGYDKWVFVAVRAFQTVLKIIPAEPLEIGSGYLYGPWVGLLLCMAGTLIGSLIIIALARVFGRRLVNVFFPTEKLNALKFLQDPQKVYGTLFFLYLIPGTPKDVLTYAASITNLDMKKFLLVTGIARIPAILTSTWCGSQLIQKNYRVAAIIFGTTLVLSILCSLLYRRFTAGRAPSENREETVCENESESGAAAGAGGDAAGDGAEG